MPFLTQGTSLCSQTGQRLGTFDQVDQVAVGVVKENQAIAAGFVRLAGELDALFLELGETGIEVVHRDGDVAHAGGLHRRGAEVTFARNDFDHEAILSFDEIISGVFPYEGELQILDVPISESLGIGGSNCKMFDT